MKDYLKELEMLEESRSKMCYIRGALESTFDLPEGIEPQLEDRYIDLIYSTESFNNLWEKIDGSIVDYRVPSGTECLSLEGKRKVVNKMIKNKDSARKIMIYLKNLYRNNPERIEDFKDLTAPYFESSINDLKRHIISSLKKQSLETPSYLGYLAKISGQSKKEIMCECADKVQMSPETQIRFYGKYGDYERVLQVAEKWRDKNAEETNMAIRDAYYELGQEFEGAKFAMENGLSWFRLPKEMTGEQRETIQRLARRNGDLETLASTYDNKWVVRAIKNRDKRKKAKTLYLRVKAFGDKEFLERVIRTKFVSPEVVFEAKKWLYRKYLADARKLEYPERVDSGCPGGPASWDDKWEAEQLKAKAESLWDNDPNKDLIPERIEDSNERAKAYEKEGSYGWARWIYECAQSEAESNLDIQEALRLKAKVQEMKEKSKDN